MLVRLTITVQARTVQALFPTLKALLGFISALSGAIPSTTFHFWLCITSQTHVQILRKFAAVRISTNARRITYLFGDTIRYIADADKCGRFKYGLSTVGDNRNSALYPLAAKAVAFMTANVAGKSPYVTAISMKKQNKMSAAVTMIKGVESVIISKKGFDPETGTLYPHSPKLFLIQQCRTIYRPNFKNETVDKFLRDIQPNADTLNALLRFTAYALIGESCEKKFLFIDGKGGNGRDTFTGLIFFFQTYPYCR